MRPPEEIIAEWKRIGIEDPDPEIVARLVEHYETGVKRQRRAAGEVRRGPAPVRVAASAVTKKRGARRRQIGDVRQVPICDRRAPGASRRAGSGAKKQKNRRTG